ncbi:hypothetical protein ATE68_21555 [Sphingopyxis sp. H038]|uniref:hypothetical protein n=1 Tax=unclassified Sphingopyxis TaxID=2614943 RepID=UPI0007307369|nr:MULTISPECIES: hypothetical protein [unclassified Sphingopyxis]KTD99651.1 hypothetical protein ATE78_22210 [Sphingopyxis sp. H012]KTE05141.1 hypothetical protein ATE76_21780 [Sphingopyxis sp. H093]KTE12354.1 hypothetical protein ATE70_03425 [Sphingopyxis sp. H053]KTE21642.1 hypothetical protein ATE75_20720 [Sphingopyxis sp. H080]KTE31563.1 hypothetical protein ATE68_21555 [Sphingopyxis sp. H038]
MRRWASFFLIATAMPAVALAASPTALGIFDGWGAFRDPATPRCYALAAPSATIGTPKVKAYASVGYWPKSRIRGQFYVRLSKERAPGRELRLTIGGRRFILTGNGAHGWAGDPRMDAAIVAAMRSAPSMSIESGTATGGAIADTYRLRGAATAIDAAALGCAKLR